jgi:hypothetical protein
MSNRLCDSDPRLKSLCRAGEGERCCRWLARGGAGFFCAKLDQDIAPFIDERHAAGILGAKGDHCPGLPPEPATGPGIDAPYLSDYDK